MIPSTLRTKNDIGLSELQFSNTCSYETWYQHENVIIYRNQLLYFVTNFSLVFVFIYDVYPSFDKFSTYFVVCIHAAILNWVIGWL